MSNLKKAKEALVAVSVKKAAIAYEEGRLDGALIRGDKVEAVMAHSMLNDLRGGKEPFNYDVQRKKTIMKIISQT